MPIGDFPERLATNARFAMPHWPRTLHHATGENKGKKHQRQVTVAAYRAGPPLHGRPSLYLTATGPRCRRPNRSVAPAAASHGRVNLAQLCCRPPPLEQRRCTATPPPLHYREGRRKEEEEKKEEEPTKKKEAETGEAMSATAVVACTAGRPRRVLPIEPGAGGHTA